MDPNQTCSSHVLCLCLCLCSHWPSVYAWIGSRQTVWPILCDSSCLFIDTDVGNLTSSPAVMDRFEAQLQGGCLKLVLTVDSLPWAIFGQLAHIGTSFFGLIRQNGRHQSPLSSPRSTLSAIKGDRSQSSTSSLSLTLSSATCFTPPCLFPSILSLQP